MNDQPRAPQTTERRWTHMYWDVDPSVGKLRPYLRLVPAHMDMGSVGFPHGLSIGGFRRSKEDADKFADRVERFMDCLVKSLVNEEEP